MKKRRIRFSIFAFLCGVVSSFGIRAILGFPPTPQLWAVFVAIVLVVAIIGGFIVGTLLLNE